MSANGPSPLTSSAARHADKDLTSTVAVKGPREVVSAAFDVEGMRLRLVEPVDDARRANEALAQRGPAVLALREALAPQPVAVTGLAVAST